MRITSHVSPHIFVRPMGPDGASAGAAMVKLDTTVPMVEPQLEPRDEAVFWLTAAAEIEHFLMVHYLFAAYSLDPEGSEGEADRVEELRDTLLQIAREEMGHLITVQNLLTLIGAPLHFGREHSPHASEIYPFRFGLERASVDSLAKYALAESPVDRAELEAGLSKEDLELYDTELTNRAIASNGGHPVSHVGPIFARLRDIFGNELAESDFRLDRAARQARWSDWGFKPSPADNVETDLEVLVRRFDHPSVAAARDAAVTAIKDVGDQGEEADIDIGDGESHFERFFEAFKAFQSIQTALGRPPVWPVVPNPNVAVAVATGDTSTGEMVEGRITAQRARRWAQLFNLRYRLLLRFLAHALHLEGSVFVGSGTEIGDRTPKGLLINWTFKEMRRVKKLAQKIVQLPLDAGASGLNAGPPFELPYRLDLAPDESDRWLGHAEVFGATGQLIGEMQLDPLDQDDAFLAFVLADDAHSVELAQLLASGADGPADAPRDFQKVAMILDEAVRGFSVGPPHAAFWRGTTLAEFLGSAIFPVVPGDPDGSSLIRRIEVDEDDRTRMPRYRPRIDQTRISYIRDWISRGAPDSVPGGNIGAPQEPSPTTEPR